MPNRAMKGATVLAATFMAASGLSSCAGDDLQPVKTPKLLTQDLPTGDGEMQFDSAWGGVIDATQECVTAHAGGYDWVVVAPTGSSVMEDSSSGEHFLQVDGENHPFGVGYRGGGVAVGDIGGEAADIPGGAECIESTDATDLLIIYSLESADT